MVEGLKLYDQLFDSSEVSKLVSLANDLRAAGRRGEYPSKLKYGCFYIDLY